MRRPHSQSPSPAPSSTPSHYSNTHPRHPMPPRAERMERAGEEARQGERGEQREVTGQGRPRSPENGAERRRRRRKVLDAPVRLPADAHPSALKSVLESANPRTDSEGAPGCTWSTARATAPSPGQPTPGVVKQDKSSGGPVDTTKTRSGPQRVRMSGGERPIGAAKGKQSDTEALCQTPPPPPMPCSCQMRHTHNAKSRNDIVYAPHCVGVYGAEVNVQWTCSGGVVEVQSRSSISPDLLSTAAAPPPLQRWCSPAPAHVACDRYTTPPQP